MAQASAQEARDTILLVFIHGFKGNDDTFGSFPTYLASLTADTLAEHEIVTVVYPAFETRGELRSCVLSFRDWLVNQVIDLEVAKGTSSPAISPRVKVILCGHSMGGIVAAETLLSVVGDTLADLEGVEQKTTSLADVVLDQLANAKGLCMFPYIQGIMAFDTPFLGICPSVVANGAEENWQTGRSWLQSASGLMAAVSSSDAKRKQESSYRQALEASAPPQSPIDSGSSRSGWAKYAAIAGAASVVAAAGGAGAYLNRKEISSGFTWGFSHLEFVGTLARPEDMKRRLKAVLLLADEYRVGFANLYTCLGSTPAGRLTSHTHEKERTFCNIPSGHFGRYFFKHVNDSASSETSAHMEMFAPKSNPDYYKMGEHARDLICGWAGAL